MKSIKKLFNTKIPAKNYFIVFLVSILVIIVTLYIRSFYLNYYESEINTSVFFNKNINQMNTSDFDYALNGVSEAILYVSYTGNKDIYNMEKRLYKELKKKNLTNKIIYWDVSEFNNDSYIDDLKEKFPEIEEQITNAPLLIYIKDGVAVEAMSSELKLIDYVVLNKLIEKYEIE